MNKDTITIQQSEWKKHRVRLKILSFIAISFFILFLFCFFGGWNIGEFTGNLANTPSTPINSSEGASFEGAYVMSVVKGFIEGIDNFWITILVVLGVIYLVQIAITISFDIIEIVLIIYMFFSKIFIFIFNRNKKKEKVKTFNKSERRYNL